VVVVDERRKWNKINTIAWNNQQHHVMSESRMDLCQKKKKEYHSPPPLLWNLCCHLYELERAGSLKNRFTVLILLHPVLQRQLKLLITAPASSESKMDYSMKAATYFIEDGSSGVGFPGMGYLNHD
jgi:hypothetical protein